MFTTRQLTVTANCEEVLTEVSIKRAHLECRQGELCTRKAPTYTTASQSVQTRQLPDEAVDIAGLEKSIEMQNIFYFVAGPSGRAV